MVTYPLKLIIFLKLKSRILVHKLAKAYEGHNFICQYFLAHKVESTAVVSCISMSMIT